MDFSYDLTIFITGILSCLLAFFLKALKEKHCYDMKTSINERDLFNRIDELQQQVIQLVKENSELKLEVAKLNNSLNELKREIKDEQIRTKQHTKSSKGVCK